MTITNATITEAPITEALERKITQALAPISLAVINESHLHAGHQEKFDGRGETHFRVRIVSDAFTGMSRIARHRAITSLLDAEFAAGLHALAIEASAPGEPVRRAI
jgi:BolA family transcriptional regulator, general stress-responsive regulator